MYKNNDLNNLKLYILRYMLSLSKDKKRYE